MTAANTADYVDHTVKHSIRPAKHCPLVSIYSTFSLYTMYSSILQMGRADLKSSDRTISSLSFSGSHDISPAQKQCLSPS